ncbi:hypothetical protein CTAYLR_008272 [Chrysophaeum taylorii]|uniref:Ammonium transporter AmtB-like domain-containing protein n=1 Tax=Chrysophaeum taylorii TaxID=2483200 RepID=A0AAD7UB78_9STRA|nr:hypothetical protein CTAYLR_008272 [Chrysophaeum taylorii]
MSNVFFMQAGFAMLEAGSVYEASVGHVLLKNIFDTSISAVLWWACGHAFAYGTDAFGETGENGFIGGSGFFYENLGSKDNPLTGTTFARTHGKAFWQFQWAFASVSATIVSGAVAGRCQLVAYICYVVFLTALVYPVVAHMAWSDDGRFSPYRSRRLVGGCGVVDVAGSGVVHVTGGVAALVINLPIFLHARHARFKKENDPDEFLGPSASAATFRVLGALILWYGWFAFNGVSTIFLAGNGALAAHAIMNTTLSAATCCLATSAIAALHASITDTHEFFGSWRRGYNVCTDVLPYDTFYPVNGILAGLVAVTAGCAVISTWGAVLVGTSAAFVYYASSRLLNYLKIDDVVDAFPVHGATGIWGVLAPGLFGTEYYYKLAIDPNDARRAKRCQGIFYGGTGASLGVSVLYLLAVIAWTSAVIFLVFFFLKSNDLITVEEPPETS